MYGNFSHSCGVVMQFAHKLTEKNPPHTVTSLLSYVLLWLKTVTENSSW